MFTIYTQPTKTAKFAAYLDGKQPTAVPSKILVGTGNKELKYKEWLKAEFSHNTKLINFLAKLFDVGQEHKCIALLTKSKHTAYQTKVVREFLIENQEAIRLMIPYLKQGMSMSKKNMDELSDEQRTSMNNSSSLTLGDLEPFDRDQILALMKTDTIEDLPQAEQPKNMRGQTSCLVHIDEASHMVLK